MNRMRDLKYLIENELFIACRFLSSNDFISFCEQRGIKTSREQLDRFEELKILFPIARVQYPKIKHKIQYTDNPDTCIRLGTLAEGEFWPGEIREEYAHFWFEKEYANHFREEGYLWEPSTRPFQAWETFVDEEGYNKIESYYSIFQCYTLYKLLGQTQMNIGAEAWEPYSEGAGHRVEKTQERAKDIIRDLQENERERETLAIICQIISNRYFPLTQSDQRSIRLSIPAHYYNWDWDTYRFKWNAKYQFRLSPTRGS